MNKLLYLMFLTGLMMEVYPSVFWVWRACRIRLSMHRNLGQFDDVQELKKYGRIGNHIRMLIQAAEGEDYFHSVERFFLISALLGVIPALLFSLIVSWKTAFLWGTLLALLPYLVLQVQLHEKRVRRSREGDILVQELLNHYQICDYNMAEALEKAALSLAEEPLGKRLFLQLAKDLQNAVTKKEVEDLLAEFRYAFDTVWGNILASNIMFSHLYGVRVDGALKDLSYCMVQSRKAIEYSRRENHEARIMLVWLTPVSFFLSIFFACRFFDFTLSKFLSYQLGTALGLQWFFSMVFCYVISLLIHGFLAKEKMDI
ncbi:MAG: hypothetical protein IKA89_04315 [Anaerotignum sp.]|nr:hypothetical protein [Anaerotignum sp.]MBR3756214.1 hypothetical protein [Bacillota bacterium]